VSDGNTYSQKLWSWRSPLPDGPHRPNDNPTTEARDRPESVEVEVTPAMLSAGRKAFDWWMRRWDYLADGIPGDEDVSLLLASTFRGMYLKSSSLCKKARNLS
jgi:hypothetical protein